MRKNGWWDTLGMDGFLEVFQRHKLDLEGVFGPMAPHMSFDEIIKMEHTRWMTTDDKQTIDLKKLITKRKNKLTMDDWITAMQSWGIPADKISELSGVAIPGDLYYEISVRQERVAKAPEQILYNTSDIQETVNMYFEDGRLSKFEGKCLKVFVNKLDKNKRNLLILDQSAFYPTSGGQLHDTGFFNIGTLGRHEVIDCIKVGKCVLHVLDKELPEEGIEGLTV
jgi:alanyl-tRNA synthetase